MLQAARGMTETQAAAAGHHSPASGVGHCLATSVRTS